MIRAATLEDIPALIELAYKFAAESKHCRAICPEQSRKALEFHIQAYESVVLVADGSEGGLAGVSLVSVDCGFTVEPQCLILVFYVCEPYRGTSLARRLIDSSVKFADNMGCTHIWAGSNGLIGEMPTAMFENLCYKAGFEPGGSTMFKVIK